MQSKPRPLSVTLLALGVLTFGIVQLLGWVSWFRLPDIPLDIPKGYLLIRSTAWGMYGVLTGVGLWLGRVWAPRLVRWGGIAVLTWFTLDRLILARSDYAFKSLPANWLLFLAGLCLILWILHRPTAKVFFSENRDE